MLWGSNHVLDVLDLLHARKSIEKHFLSFQIEKSKSIKEPGSCEEHASLVKHSDTNGTNV